LKEQRYRKISCGSVEQKLAGTNKTAAHFKKIKIAATYTGRAEILEKWGLYYEHYPLLIFVRTPRNECY
jgi:hypothetical protein